VGRLAGFRYREVVKRLKRCGFQFDRQAAGSHEICRRESTWMNFSRADGSDRCRSSRLLRHGKRLSPTAPTASVSTSKQCRDTKCKNICKPE